MSNMIRCSECGETKPSDAFYASTIYTGGRTGMCKPCWSAYLSEYRHNRYHNDPIYRENQKARDRARHRARYVRRGYEKTRLRHQATLNRYLTLFRERQPEIDHWLADGVSSRRIAGHLNISEHVVRRILKHLGYIAIGRGSARRWSKL